MIVVVMGVCGAGKTTVGKLIAEELGARFEEGDRYHPAANVEKMSRGEPLNDDDRWPWLHALADAMAQWRARGEHAVIACSALKDAYRRVLVDDHDDVYVVYLRGNADLIGERMAARQHHFMPTSLLPSQFATLEEPAPGPHVVVADVDRAPADTADSVLDRLRRETARPA